MAIRSARRRWNSYIGRREMSGLQLPVHAYFFINGIAQLTRNYPLTATDQARP